MAVRRQLERWQFWREVIRRQEASGLSVAAFCREEQVAPASFFAWRKKLAEADQQVEQAESGRNANPAPESNASNAAPERGTSATPGRSANAAHAQFVPIELSPWPQNTARFEIVHPDGYRVVVPARFDAESLREILRVLKEVASC
jgi:hypothetical protein